MPSQMSSTKGPHAPMEPKKGIGKAAIPKMMTTAAMASAFVAAARDQTGMFVLNNPPHLAILLQNATTKRQGRHNDHEESQHNASD